MLKFYIIFSLIITIPGISTAIQIPNEMLNEINPASFETKTQINENIQKRINFEKMQESAIKHRPYDVLNYDLYMDWYHPLSVSRTDSNGNPFVDSLDRIWTGVNALKILVDSENVRSIELDAAGLYMDSIYVNNNLLQTTPQPQNSVLHIPLESPGNPGDTINLVIYYSFVSNENKGFYLYPKHSFGEIMPNLDTAYVEERLAYTMSEPEDARYWMPCNDEPYNKARSTITVRVPLGYSVASNGLLRKIDSTKNFLTFYWGDTTKIATYLMAATASIYKEFSDWYYRITDSVPVEVKYYVWQKDYDETRIDGIHYNPRHFFSKTVEMMQFFSKTFFEFPQVKYGMALLMPFKYGGMEHQTMTSMTRHVTLSEAYDYVAHELAHQWIGDYVTCATWNDIWINEGGAVWATNMWGGYLFGSAEYYVKMKVVKDAYIASGGLSLPPIYGIPTSLIFADPYSELVYNKAAWVYHSLRMELGDSVFFPALREMLHQHAFSSIETDDFRDAFKQNVKNSPIDFDLFFDQWLRHAGHPVFDMDVKSSPDGTGAYNAYLTLTQTQSGTLVPDTFKTMVRVIFFGKESVSDSLVFTVNQKEQTFNFQLPFSPDSVDFDYAYTLLQKRNITLLDVADNFNPAIDKPFLYPNPATGDNSILSFVANTPAHANLVLLNSMGCKVRNIYSGTVNSGKQQLNINTSDLAPGVYFIRGTIGTGLVSTKLDVVR